MAIIYGIGFLYTAYMTAVHLFVYFANEKAGHTESFRVPLIYIVSALLFGVVAFIGYKLCSGHNVNFVFKALFFLPFAAVILYVLWAILLVISSGGKWN